MLRGGSWTFDRMLGDAVVDGSVFSPKRVVLI